jgi:hypothetical protein
MSKTKQKEQGAAPAGARKDWELFWRVIAGLVLLVIVWVVWVLYQITPRSVVTPLAYANQTRPIGAQPSAAGAGAPAPALAAPATHPASAPAAGELAIDLAQAAARSGAHQASADVQAAALEQKETQVKGEGLRLATEIAAPPEEHQSMPKTEEAKPGDAPAVPAAAGAAGKDRP